MTRRLTPERAAEIVRQSGERPLDRLSRDAGRRALRDRLLLLRARRAGDRRTRAASSAEANAQASRRSRRATTSTRRTARAATARNGQGGIGPVLNDQMQAVRPPQPAVHPERAVLRRPLRLRQPEEPHAGLGPGRTADRSTTSRSTTSSRSSAPPTTRLRRARPDTKEPVTDADRQGGDVQGLARPELQAGAECHAVPGLLDRRVQDRPAPSGSPQPSGSARRPRPSALGLGRPLRRPAAAVAPRSRQGRRTSRSTRRTRRGARRPGFTINFDN